MSTRALSKQYLCRVHGAFPEHRIRVDAPIKLFEHRFCLNATSSQGRPSETIFERLWTNTEQSIIRALPITGRSHQIRVHLRHLGFPIVGDSLYGAETWPESLKPGMHPTDEQIELVKAKLLERKRQPAIFKCCKDCQESAYSQDITERIMLHAYSYSGPDWDFRSALPSWAKYVFSDPGRE
jgi:23S rRNA-/tRNA-specific pseudouridylate synthase